MIYKNCGIEEVKKYQAVLPKYQIFVLPKDRFSAIVYSGPEGGIPLYLLHICMVVISTSSQQRRDVLEGTTSVLNVGRDMTTKKYIPATTLISSANSLIRKSTGNIVAYVTVNSQTFISRKPRRENLPVRRFASVTNAVS